ncbi:ribonuclease H-like YkuK family protein [Mesobacillus subterraneus]|uniref:ribonuclease H-like YkuK family protein n=1 Tax=Mesobacillus subterraneus TaxID=285983 RepID=UPI001CFDED07|nr:ribonuclease H-like YkuK family protein [Mesobacillus subterraneus]WLR57345.1 ribonuclease H-like YkuK family protein [Mesobacillus subterraneus]
MKLQNSFQNLSKRNMDFEEVFQHILAFIRLQPNGNHRLIIGTDSQVHSSYTRFITGVVIQREGKGVWACYRSIDIARRILSLQEKISLETGFTQDVACMFTPEKQNHMINLLLPYVEKGASFKMVGHLDLGRSTKNKTRVYVNEMIQRIESIGLEAEIKPDSFVASSYANRYTK